MKKLVVWHADVDEMIDVPYEFLTVKRVVVWDASVDERIDFFL